MPSTKRDELQGYVVGLNAAVAKLQFTKEPKELYAPIEYILNLGGKRARPLLTVLSYQLCGGKNIEDILDVALTVEVFHNFTLIHDDIMDKAPLRRGKATVHEKWNTPIAILSGDAMLIEAYNILAQSPVKDLKHLIQRFNKTALDVCEGQQWDMNFETAKHVTEQEYINMIRLKTAVLLGFSLEFGGLLADADANACQQLYEAATNIGIGFQLKDDLLDVYGDADKFGKQVGGDIISNKKTYLLIKALELAEAQGDSELTNWIDRKVFEPEEKVKAVRAIYDNLGIRPLAENKMNEYFELGLKTLSALPFPDKNKEALRSFFLYLIERDK